MGYLINMRPFFYLLVTTILLLGSLAETVRAD